MYFSLLSVIFVKISLVMSFFILNPLFPAMKRRRTSSKNRQFQK
ncbi:hypothetical protein HMPREF9184_00861 [Streptococcus sp. oral taxon 058 str. F0407]|nr:hypothetical protein HMPREF9184_00861 [Streptococcus sp. oral taxon 058 str. F0407]